MDETKYCIPSHRSIPNTPLITKGSQSITFGSSNMGCLYTLQEMLIMMTSSNFPHYWPFVRGIHQSPVNSPHKGQWRRALMFSLICVWINGYVNNRKAGDLRCYSAHYDVTLMLLGNTVMSQHPCYYSSIKPRISSMNVIKTGCVSLAGEGRSLECLSVLQFL